MTTIATSARAAAALLLAGTLALPAAAQSTASSGGWSAFAGCWRPLSPDASLGSRWSAVPNAGAPTLCVLPTANGSATELVTLAGDSVAVRDTVDVAAGNRVREREGCTGTESAAWSADGLRLYMRASYSCPRGLAQTSSGVLALSTGEELLDVEQSTRGAAKGVHVSRYVRVPTPSGLPGEIAARLPRDDLAVSIARGTASAPLTVAAIGDLSRGVDPEVVEALLVEHGDQIAVDAKTLAALAAAGVPGRTTDLLVALAYPRRFALATATPARSPNAVTANDRVPRTIIDPSLIGYSSIYGPLGYGMYAYSPYGYGPYRYSPYGYGGYGYGGYAYGYYQPPIVVVRTEPPRPHGHVVNGRGYSRGGDEGTSGGTTAQPRGGSSSSGSTSSGSSGTSSSGSSSSSSGSSSSGETRTAKPRP